MNRKDIQIGKDKIILSERIAQDVLNLSALHEERKDKTTNVLQYNLFLYSATVADSIRSSLVVIPWYKFILRWKYKRLNQTRLVNLLSLTDLTNLFIEVMLLEGVDVKKNLKPVENQ